MFKQRCPRCKSVRIQLGFNEPPPILKLLGIRELFCNNCSFEFTRFAPSTRLKRSQSGERETTLNQRRAPRFKTQLRVRLAMVLKERFGEEALYGSELSGYIRDVSKIGLAIVLPELRPGSPDFTDSKMGFCAWVDLPTETVKMRIVPVRREKLLAGPDKGHLLIGAHIRSISEADRVSLHRYIETLQQ
jgi:hypothetical protein